MPVSESILMNQGLWYYTARDCLYSSLVPKLTSYRVQVGDVAKGLLVASYEQAWPAPQAYNLPWKEDREEYILILTRQEDG